MPSETKKQKVAMAIACHHPKKSTAGIPKDVACEFNRADAAKQKRAKRKVKEAVEYLETLKMIENVRNMSFTGFLVENAGRRQAPDALGLIAQIENEAQEAVASKTPGAITFFQRLKQALRDPKIENRLMGAVRARDAYHATNEGLTQTEADLITEAVEIPADASPEKLSKMMDAAKNAMSILAKIKNVEYRAKRHKEITSNMNKIRAALKKAKGIDKKSKTTSESTRTVDKVLEEKKKPSAGLNKAQKSKIVKKAHSGKNVFGGGFDKVEKNAEKKYGSKKAGEKVAASVMWKKARKKAAMRESVNFASPEIDFIVESAFEFQKMMKKLNKVFEQHLDPADYDDKATIIKIAMKHGAEEVKGFEVMTEDEKMDLIFETCMKYDLAEAFGDDVDGPDADADDPEMFSRGVGPDDQEIGTPQTQTSKSNFKLEPADIGRLAEIIAQNTDFPPEDSKMAAAVEKLQYADLFHLTPPEVVIARRLLAQTATQQGA